jgi:hypothetical protein
VELTRRAFLGLTAGAAAGCALGQPRLDAAPARAALPRMAGVRDLGPVLPPSAPYDRNGVREVVLYADPARPGRLLAHYDGCGDAAWLACLAHSDDAGRTWIKSGPVLGLGPAGSAYDASASSPWVRYDNGLWHMFYLGAGRATGDANHIPQGPYQTLRAQSTSPYGPWTQAGGVLFGGSPGPVLRWGGRWWMFTSGGGIVLASTANLRTGPWVRETAPILPRTEALENAALWSDAGTGLWWLMANRITTDPATGVAYTDAVVAYWATDPLRGWSPDRKAVVLDAANTGCGVVGMPSVLPSADGRLWLAYDGRPGPAGSGTGRWDHMGRSGRLASVARPLAVA